VREGEDDTAAYQKCMSNYQAYELQRNYALSDSEYFQQQTVEYYAPLTQADAALGAEFPADFLLIREQCGLIDAWRAAELRSKAAMSAVAKVEGMSKRAEGSLCEALRAVGSLEEALLDALCGQELLMSPRERVGDAQVAWAITRRRMLTIGQTPRFSD
jgi:hypothetical protein